MCLELCLPFLGTVLGACAAWGMPRGSRRWNAALAGAAGGAMLAACIWNLLLPALEAGKAPAVAGFALGLVALLVPERLPGRALPPGAALVAAVVLHNIPEGMAVGTGASDGLTLGIALQNIPDGAVAAVPLLALGLSRKRAFAAGVLTGAVEPLAAGLMLILSAAFTPWMPALLGFAAGAMTFVVLRELAPAMGESGWGMVCFALGFLLMVP